MLVGRLVVNPFMHNVENHKTFKVYLAIFLHYAWRSQIIAENFTVKICLEDKSRVGSIICSNFGLKMNTILKNFKNNVSIIIYSNCECKHFCKYF